MQVRIAGIIHESVTDGPGVRSVVFFQGCQRACPGCHNPHTWKLDGGEQTDTQQVMARLKITPLISGITLSGGEPFLQAEAAAEIAQFARSAGLDVWVFTGNTWEDLLAGLDKPGYRELVEAADVIVDGPYQQDLRDLSLAYRGSRNQRIIRVRESLEAAQVMEGE